MRTVIAFSAILADKLRFVLLRRKCCLKLIYAPHDPCRYDAGFSQNVEYTSRDAVLKVCPAIGLPSETQLQLSVKRNPNCCELNQERPVLASIRKTLGLSITLLNNLHTEAGWSYSSQELFKPLTVCDISNLLASSLPQNRSLTFL